MHRVRCMAGQKICRTDSSFDFSPRAPNLLESQGMSSESKVASDRRSC